MQGDCCPPQQPPLGVQNDASAGGVVGHGSGPAHWGDAQLQWPPLHTQKSHPYEQFCPAGAHDPDGCVVGHPGFAPSAPPESGNVPPSAPGVDEEFPQAAAHETAAKKRIVFRSMARQA
jgi:hypothetical protein